MIINYHFFKEKNGSLNQKILFYYRDTIKKVDPKYCEKTAFDLYFNDVYNKIDCYPPYSPEKRLFFFLNKEENSKLFDPSQIAQKVISKNLRAFNFEFFIIDSFLSVYNLSVEINPTGAVKVKDDIFSFNINDKIRMRRSYLLVVMGFFLIYYGYETLQDILSGEFLSTQRLVMEGLDLLNFYFLSMSIFYLYTFTYLHKADFLPFLKGFGNKQGSVVRQIIVDCVESFKNFSNFFSCFFIISFGRLFKYSIIFRPFEIIVKSIKTICFNIYQFSLFYTLIFIGFALFGMSMFGQTIKSYSTLQSSCLTLVGIVFGELNFKNYYNHNSSVGTIYFCLYVITVVIILFNILCVVITESYRSMKFYMKSESQRLNVVPDCYFIRRNFNLLVKIKLKYYQPEMRAILEGMVMMKTANRFLTKVEVDHDLKTFEYSSNALNAVLKKYGYKSQDIEWKKNQMDSLRSKVEKERRHLNDLFLIHMKINRQFFEQKYKLENSKNLFISKERYLNLDRKIMKLKRLLDILKKKANLVTVHVNDFINEKFVAARVDHSFIEN